MLDCTCPWPAVLFPFHSLASLHMDRLLSNAAVETLHFNLANTPAELALPPAESAACCASLAVLRAHVYAMVSRG